MRKTTAADIMTREVITVDPEMDVEAFGRLLSERRISGAPVVDAEGRLVGIVTEMDLIRQNARLHIPTVFRIFDAAIVFEKPGRIREEIRRMAATRVGELCTRDVITIGPATTVPEIATIMSERKVHLLPVIEDERIAGIVGKADLVRALSEIGGDD